MVEKRIRGVVGIAALSLMVGGCTEGSAPEGVTGGVRTLASALSGPQVVDQDEAGVPTFLAGELGGIAEAAAGQESLSAELAAPALASLAPRFRLDPSNLRFERAYTDAQGDTHYRYQVLHNELPIYGGELRLHARGGKVFAANTNVRGDLQAPEKATVAPEAAMVAAQGDRESPKDARIQDEPKLVYWRSADKLLLTYEVRLSGELEDGTPVDDSVLVNAVDGSVVMRIPHIHSALDRVLHDGGNLSSLPGPLARSEGQEPVADDIVNSNYDHLGTTYNCYNSLFGRDSFDNAGASLISTVHHRVKYVNAFWNGTQMVYGDGDDINASNLANSLDVTAHELTHAVTDSESDLIYSGESGGLNEAMSDIFGAVCEWYGDGKVVSEKVWLIGDSVWTPSIPGDALRYMHSPTLDGSSLDYFPDYYSGVDVHYSSGIANAAFYLLSQGGTHPRGKTTTVVPAIGIEKAAQIFYKANADLMVPTTNFEQAKVATEQAAQQLGYDAATVEAVSQAWKAVGVGVPIPPPPSTPINKNVPVSDLSGTRGQAQYFTVEVPEGAYDLTFTMSGGTGDADLYVRFGSAPTTTTYDCRPYKSGNQENCLFATAQQGTYYVMLRAFSSYSGVTLNVTWKGGYIPIEEGSPVEALSGVAGSEQIFKLSVPPLLQGTTNNVHVRLFNGAGNADLYVQGSSAPSTFNYECRGVNDHSTEVCNLNNVPPGNYYILVYGAKGGYSGLTLEATHD